LKNDKNTRDEKMVSRYSYSKNLEFEADSLGLLRFLKTGYSLEAPEQTFDKLKYSYLPYGNLPFDKNFFGCKLSDKYFLDKVNPIKGLDESETDSLHSHPNFR